MKVLLAVVVFIGIAAVIGAVVVGKQSFDGTVVEKPYETGIAYDDIRRARDASGWKISLLNTAFAEGRNDLRIVLTDREGNALRGAQVAVKVSRPATADFDRKYAMSGGEGGTYRADITLGLFGQWDFLFEVTHQGKNISIDRKIFAERSGKQ